MVKNDVSINFDYRRVMIIETCTSSIQIDVLICLKFRSYRSLKYFPITVVRAKILIIFVALLKPKFVRCFRFQSGNPDLSSLSFSLYKNLILPIRRIVSILLIKCGIVDHGRIIHQMWGDIVNDILRINFPVFNICLDIEPIILGLGENQSNLIWPHDIVFNPRWPIWCQFEPFIWRPCFAENAW